MCHTAVQQQYKPEDIWDHLYIVESVGSLFVMLWYRVQLRLVQDYCCERFPLKLILEDDDEVGNEMADETRNFWFFQVYLATGGITETRELGNTSFF